MAPAPRKVAPRPMKPAVPQSATSRKRGRTARTDESPATTTATTNASHKRRRLLDGLKPKGQASQTAARPFSIPFPHQQLQIFVCGAGSGGELGLGNATGAHEARAPRPNPNLNRVVAIAAGGMHAAAITTDHQIITWGINDTANLARDTTWEAPLKDIDDADDDSSAGSEDDDLELNPLESTPTLVASDNFPPGTKFVQVTASDSATFALTSNGSVYGWGIFRDNNGAYAFTFDPSRPFVTGQKDMKAALQRAPLLIPGLKNIVQISAGAEYVLALDSSGRVFAWGNGQQGELGRRLLERRRPQALLPTQVELPRRKKIVRVSAGLNHAFAIDADGDTWSWGANNFGQTGIDLGVGEGEAVVASPTKVVTLARKKMKTVVGGLHHSLGLTDSGECLVWGRIDGGQAGIGLEKLMTEPSHVLTDSRDRPRILLHPKQVPIPPCVAVAAGSDHCIAVTAEGKAYSWGFNASHQCNLSKDEEIQEALVMDGKHIREEHLVWADAGGQYSLLGARSK